jgi:hypothetical protein
VMHNVDRRGKNGFAYDVGVSLSQNYNQSDKKEKMM